MTNKQFEMMVEQYQKLVYTVCWQLVRNAQTAEDLTQDTFVAAYIHKEDCPPDSYKPWLARIATNKAKDFLKSSYHRKSLATQDTDMPETSPFIFIPQPEDIAIEKDAVASIKNEILALQEPYLLVSKMFFIEQRSVDEIAKALGRPSKTVHSQLSRAKTKLQNVIERRR